MTNKIKELKAHAQRLINLGNSKEKMEGVGMNRILDLMSSFTEYDVECLNVIYDGLEPTSELAEYMKKVLVLLSDVEPSEGEFDIVHSISEIIKKEYNGHLICEEQRADLFVYIDGVEETIESICTDTIYFENDYHTTKFLDADIQHLSYIYKVIGGKLKQYR